MINKYIPEMMDQDEQLVINALIESLKFLKKEATREGQSFIAYAIEDAILQARHVRGEKFIPQPFQNMQ